MVALKGTLHSNMADALASDTSLLGSTVSGFTYNRTKPKRKGLILALFVITVLIAGIIVVIYISGDESSSSDTPTPAPTESYLLHASHIPVKYIHRISTYRSAIGGSWPGTSSFFNHNQTCASLKHWFEPFPDLNFEEVIVYSPLQGQILEVTYSDGRTNDSFGYDIRIKGTPTDGFGSFIVQIEHVNITDHEQITAGNSVSLGYPIGHHVGSFVNSGISVLNQSYMDGQYISMFNVIDDKTLKEFQSWNVSNRTYPVISYPQRQMYPLNCTGNGMSALIVNDTNYAKLPNWVELNTTSPTVLRRKKEQTKATDLK